ncbi:hypothetical protein [Thiorhodococcus mannitoliphagus]|uniref:hypothetical protein n=1 Tax=Thiorhodococcus mannitoliphagus TaxID=329406 RepID=UPI0013DFA92F|nr:hypothetical protein [Thiorhodococcus mannitoliphagus]
MLLILLHPLLVGFAWWAVFFAVFLSMIVIASVCAVPSDPIKRMIFSVLADPCEGPEPNT